MSKFSLPKCCYIFRSNTLPEQATETGQQWSYFTGLYFSYTTLLTIGYGDIYPVSNAGRPFFVFWSLLAVPSLTILISNMGDTIVKAIRDLTLKIGELTVLPDESGVRATMKHTVHQVPILSTPKPHSIKQKNIPRLTTKSVNKRQSLRG